MRFSEDAAAQVLQGFQPLLEFVGWGTLVFS